MPQLRNFTDPYPGASTNWGCMYVNGLNSPPQYAVNYLKRKAGWHLFQASIIEQISETHARRIRRFLIRLW
jgi:hypothetical protein